MYIIVGIKMLKNHYLKHIIFFVLLLSYSKYSCSMDERPGRDELRDNRRVLLLDDYDRGYYRPDVKANTPMFDVIRKGVKEGTADALKRAALDVITIILQILPFSVKKFISMIKIYSYKGAFGTTGLTVKDLTKFSNRINSLCSPLASSQTGNMRKTKRAGTIESEQNNAELVDSVWLNRQIMLISELEHVITYLKRELPCYNSAFQSVDSTFIERQMAGILYALSTENNDEIQSYLIRLIGYIKDLISMVNSFNSFDNAIEHSDETKTLLNVIRLTFEHIASFLADANFKGTGTFQKIADDASSNKRDFMDILGNGALK